MTELKLPEKIVEIKEKNPTDLIIISVPKTGKSTILADLTKSGDGIMFNLEKSGTDYLEGYFLNIYPEAMSTIDEAIENYKGYRDLLLSNKGKYKYLIIASLTALNDMSEIMGTYYPPPR